jgi:putative endonuclease
MYFVYILKNNSRNFIYLGSTPNLKRRVYEHNTEKVKSTKFYIPLELVYYEAYKDKKDALEREHKLKHHGSVMGHLKKRIKNSLIS